MKCPACSTVLIVVEREGIELDWCVGCHGLWFDEGELELLGEQTGRALETEDMGRRAGDTVASGGRRCPRCRRKMEQVSLAIRPAGAVGIDRCPDHGMWLDRGELSQIMTRRRPADLTDEGVVIQFLGETFGALPAAVNEEGRDR